MIVILTGVSGAGKTTVGRLLAARLGWTFLDADDLHPSRNVEKMRAGIPLTDGDRAPWLERVRAAVVGLLERGEGGVVACSALKRSYRERLRAARSVRIVFLEADADLLRERLRARRHRFMRETLLRSQLADLEQPAPDEAGCRMDASAPAEEVVERILTECLRDSALQA